MSSFKNLLLSFGAYYLAIWLRLLLEWPWSFVSNRLSFIGDLQSMLLMPAVWALPSAVAAFAAGVAIGHVVEARFASRWALLPAALFFEQHIFGYRTWVIGPTKSDYVSIAVGAAIPALACVVGAVIAEGKRKRSVEDELRSQKVD